VEGVGSPGCRRFDEDSMGECFSGWLNISAVERRESRVQQDLMEVCSEGLACTTYRPLTHQIR
jgi:hypothetical protein